MALTSSVKKSILITGANRGVGLTLSKLFLEQGWTVIAAARDVSKLSQQENQINVKIDSSSATDAEEAAKDLKTKHGITQIDIVLANAGIAGAYSFAKDTSTEDFDDLYAVNVRGPFVLYKAFYPFLQEGSTFAAISSGLGSISRQHYPKMAAYGMTKVSLNYLTRSIHFEEPKLKAFTIHPGFLDTDMGNKGAGLIGLDGPPQKVAETGPGIVKILLEATRETHGGYMWNFDGTKAVF
ncbi:hypothetical protein IAT38_005534 [Cryptococcus sp. DSM 104549]